MNVVEIFQSIDGEADRAGQLTNFIRLAGCNLRCSYCDTSYSHNKCDGEFIELHKIFDKLSTDIRNVTVTGGEPLLSPNIHLLLKELIRRGYDVSVETNGSVNIKEFIEKFPSVSYVVDYKCPSSGMEDKMDMQNYKLLRQGKDVLKFVVGSIHDLEVASRIYSMTGGIRIPHSPTYFSPVFGKIEPSEIVEFMMEKKLTEVKIQLQLHKIIWDKNKRGV